MHEKINNIFESMARDANLAETYGGNLVIDQIRRSFYKAVSTPICLDDVQSMDEQKRQRHVHGMIQNTIRSWFESNMASSTIDYIAVSDLDLTNNTFKLSCSIKCVLWVRSHNYHSIKKTKSLVIASKRKMKLSSYFDKYFQPALLELNGDNSEYIQAYNRDEIIASTQRGLKQYATSVSETDPNHRTWVYFTTTDVPYHYQSLRIRSTLSSCMSYGAGKFGNKMGDDFVHPLEGYHYAPDFRLGLVSYQDPESIKTCTKYPFVGRVIVFSNAIDNPIAFSRYYGDENVLPKIRTMFTHVEKPNGKQFYAVKATHSDNNESGHDVLGYIRRHVGEKVDGFLVAPFIDSGSNSFIPVNEATVKREDGREVMLMVVCESIDKMDEHDFEDYESYESAWNLQIYYDTGIVQQQKADGIGTYTLERGKWVCGEQEW